MSTVSEKLQQAAAAGAQAAIDLAASPLSQTSDRHTVIERSFKDLGELARLGGKTVNPFRALRFAMHVPDGAIVNRSNIGDDNG